MAPIIELDNVDVSLGGRAVLRGLSLSVERGQTVGVIGPNGAGKTTLLRVLLGMHRLGGGTLSVLAQNPCELRGAALARFRVRVGYMPQLDLAPSRVPLRVREVVEISRAGRVGLLRSLRAEDGEAVQTWLEQMGLAPLAERTYAELSGGQQRKVQLARALAQEPDVLLMDEPASNLDLVWQENLVRLVEQVASTTGVTILLVSHDFSLLPRSCDRVAVLQEGALAAVGPPQDVLVPEVLSDLYEMPVEVVRRGGRYHVFPRTDRQEE